MTNRELLFILRMRNEASKVLQSAGNDFRKMGREAGKSTKDIERTTKATQGLNQMLSRVKTAFIGLAAAFGGRAIAKATLEFETSLQTIVGLVGVAQSQVDAWRDSILELGPATARGPNELAEAMFFITSAGARGAEAMDILTASARAATAGLGQTKDVAFAVVSAVNAYGSANISAAEATDILVKTVREGNLEASTLAQSLGAILPTAVAAGVELEEVGAAAAALTRSGISASEAINSTRGVLVAMNRATTEGVVALEKAGLSFRKLRTIIKDEGLLAGLNALNDAVDGDAEALTNILGRVEATNAVLALTGPQAESVARIFASLADSAGAVDEAFAAVAETSQVRLNSALAQLEAQMIEIGGTVLPSLVAILGVLAENIDLIITSIILFAGVKGIGLAVVALSALNITISSGTIAALFRLRVAFGLSVAATGAMTTAVASLIAALRLLWPLAILAGVAVGLRELGKEMGEVSDEADETAKSLLKIQAALEAISKEDNPFRLSGSIGRIRTDLNNTLNEAEAALNEFNNENRGSIGISLFSGIADNDLKLQLVSNVNAAREALNGFNVAVKETRGIVGQGIGDVEASIDEAAGRFNEVEIVVEGFADAMKAAGDETDLLGQKLAAFEARGEGGVRAIEAREEALDQLGLASQEFSRLSDAEKNAVSELTAALIDANTAERIFKETKSEAARVEKETTAARVAFSKSLEAARSAEVEQLIAFADGFDATLQSLKDEIRLVGLDEKAHRRMAAVIALENLARENNVENINEQLAALDKMLNTLEQAEAQQMTFGAGIERALRRMGDELEDVATRADQAFTKTFNDLSTLINTFVLDGTADIQGFFRSLNETLVSEATKDLFQIIKNGGSSENTFFGGLIDTLGGLFGGGDTKGAGVATPDGTLQNPLHVVMQDLDITSLPGLPQFLPKVGPGEGPPGSFTNGDGSDIITERLDTGFTGMFSFLGNIFSDIKAGFLDILGTVGNAVTSILGALFGGKNSSGSKSDGIFSALTGVVGAGLGLLGSGGGGGGGGGSTLFTNAEFFGSGKRGGMVDNLPEMTRASRDIFRNAPSFAGGGTTDGIPIIAHPGEAVVPLDKGRAIPVELSNNARDLGTNSAQGVNLNIIANFQDVSGFRENAEQIGADAARQLMVVMARNT